MLTIRDLTASLEGKRVLKGFNLRVESGEIFCLLGPSGCGKTTLLRVIAGLEDADGGSVLVDGQHVLGRPANERGFGLMFQNYALFPHMNVAQNVMFGLKMRKYSNRDARKRMEEVLALVEMTDFAERSVSKLSGGQQQRVALARSLAPNPRLLMLDEPLASLDVALKRTLMLELHQIVKRVGITTIYVTHAQEEAFALGDRVGIMNEGRIEQIGTARTLYSQPETIFTARFLGLTNIIPIDDFDGSYARTMIGDFPVRRDATAILVHPDGVRVAPPDTPGAISGRLIDRMFQGNTYRARAEIAPEIVFSFNMSALDPRVPDVGDNVGLLYDDASILGLVG